ncbi:hypothetical protein DSM112329_03930 [Paraconexibacter sp. AEG42_29]|uniref:KOW domain-containing protein n=1 Tax=Paraconexibacter sp. AEG42_29 TaxID=2997339 RepID=A0AAU7AZZ6_9ACTN
MSSVRISPGDLVLAQDSAGRFHAVVQGTRLGRITVQRCDGRPARPLALRDVLQVFKPAGTPDAPPRPEPLKPTAQLHLDL